jgi:GNAT superfamily N-acetyltransferase
MAHGWSVTRTSVHDPVSVDLLWHYFFDVASSYHGRTATDAELKQALAEDPSDDLVPPTGLFLVGRYHGVPSGCVGLRFGPPGFAELTRMFVAPEVRGTGGGTTLLAVAEAHAGDAHTIRLDTRLDLTSARRLYESHGYVPVPAYSHGSYAQCWYAKRLAPQAVDSDDGAHDG